MTDKSETIGPSNDGSDLLKIDKKETGQWLKIRTLLGSLVLAKLNSVTESKNVGLSINYGLAFILLCWLHIAPFKEYGFSTKSKTNLMKNSVRYLILEIDKKKI